MDVTLLSVPASAGEEGSGGEEKGERRWFGDDDDDDGIPGAFREGGWQGGGGPVGITEA